jgi:hypothetical protein
MKMEFAKLAMLVETPHVLADQERNTSAATAQPNK